MIMHPPNYSRLLQNFLEPNPQPLPAIEFEDFHAAVDLVEFLGEELLFSETIPAQPPTLAKLPKSLPLSLRKALKAAGITHLYSHQLETLEALRGGKDIILSTTTASGKSLSAYLPILEGVLQHNYAALSLYGLKALTSDQEQKLSELLRFLPEDERPSIAMLNGDVSKSRREELLTQSPSLIAATPELIHYALRGMYWSEPLQQFLKQLRYVLLDEAHTLQGSYGANMTLLLQRLKLAVDRYGGNSRRLQFIFLSATVGNPRQLARRLTGRRSRKQAKRLVWIKNSGAASPERQLIVTKPSLNPNPDVAKIILFLLRQGLSGICFCNGRATLKSVLGTLTKEAVAQGYPGIEQQVALFYGGLSNERRTEIIAQLQRGQVRCILSTSALEAGIDLAALDFALLRSFPGSLQGFRQRIGRCGRKQRGIAVFLPLEQSPLDCYYAQHPERLLEAPPERVSFNANYPINLGKHLMCAAVESGIPVPSIKRYFGKSAPQIASAILAQGAMRKTRGRLWAKGFPHRDVNFRGGINSTTVDLIETETGELIEQMSGEIAMREVFPGAIYRTQDSDGQMLTYRSTALSLELGQAQLQRIPETTMYTVALSETESQVVQDLVKPRELPLLFLNQEDVSLLNLRLAWGEVTNRVSGYQLLMKQYERTCLNQKCINYREPLPSRKVCLACGKRTRKAELVTVLDEVEFEQPFVSEFTTPITQLHLNKVANEYLQTIVEQMRKERRDLSQLWEYPAQLLAIHSFGHQVLVALPLVVLGSLNDVNFIVEAEDKDDYGGYFYDLSESGNGMAEAIFRHLPKLAKVGAELAQDCECEQGCPRCLVLPGCPDGNQGLLKQVGLRLSEALVAGQE